MSKGKSTKLSDRYNLDDANRVTSAKDFVYKATELQDHETQAAMKIIYDCHSRYGHLPNTDRNLMHYRDEILTRLANIGILATFDPVPCLQGQPPIVEIVGKVHDDPIHKYGFDHEQKEYEVKEAVKRGEEWRGQKERNRAEKKG